VIVPRRISLQRQTPPTPGHLQPLKDAVLVGNVVLARSLAAFIQPPWCLGVRSRNSNLASFSRRPASARSNATWSCTTAQSAPPSVTTASLVQAEVVSHPCRYPPHQTQCGMMLDAQQLATPTRRAGPAPRTVPLFPRLFPHRVLCGSSSSDHVPCSTPFESVQASHVASIISLGCF